MKKRLCATALCFLLSLSVLSVPVLANDSPEKHFNIPDYNVTIVNSNNIYISNAEFETLIGLLPELREIPSVTRTLESHDDVVLTPYDLWNMYLVANAPNGMDQIAEIYGGKEISIAYLGDSVIRITMTQDIDSTITRGGDVITTRTDSNDFYYFGNRYGLHIDVTARAREVWNGGTNTFFAYIDYNMVESDSTNTGAWHRDTVVDIREEHSPKNKLSEAAYLKLWIQTANMPLNFYGNPHIEFTWG